MFSTFSLIRNIPKIKRTWSFSLSTTSILRNTTTVIEQPQLETREINKDRSQEIPVETSIRYLKSPAFQQTYGGQPVWVLYRRNHKGGLPPRKTRKTCIRQGKISTGNPCPICRDEYLVLHETNTELLKQFISPHTGAILSYEQTGICQRKYQELVISIQRAIDRGLLTFDVPFRQYNYADYYPEYSTK